MSTQPDTQLFRDAIPETTSLDPILPLDPSNAASSHQTSVPLNTTVALPTPPLDSSFTQPEQEYTASSYPVKVTLLPNRGRSYVATREIEKDEVVFVAESYGTTMCDAWLDCGFCHFCWSRIPDRKAQIRLPRAHQSLSTQEKGAKPNKRQSTVMVFCNEKCLEDYGAPVAEVVCQVEQSIRRVWTVGSTSTCMFSNEISKQGEEEWQRRLTRALDLASSRTQLGQLSDHDLSYFLDLVWSSIDSWIAEQLTVDINRLLGNISKKKGIKKTAQPKEDGRFSLFPSLAKYLFSCVASGLESRTSDDDCEKLRLMAEALCRRQLEKMSPPSTATQATFADYCAMQSNEVTLFRDALRVLLSEEGDMPFQNATAKEGQLPTLVALLPAGFHEALYTYLRLRDALYLMDDDDNTIHDRNQDISLMSGLSVNHTEFRSMLYKEVANSFGIWEGEDELLGYAVFPRACFFNHSCEPNIQKKRALLELPCVNKGTTTEHTTQRRRVMVFSATRKIKEGEECCISYGDIAAGRAERQDRLHQIAMKMVASERYGDIGQVTSDTTLPTASTSTEPKSTLITARASTSTTAMDDLAALDMLMEKDAETEVKELKALVEKLRKEIAFKDETIAKLQRELERRPTIAASSASAAGGSSTDTNSLVHAHRDPTMQCAVCVDYFAVPYTVECGHTFCYTCLHSWLAIRKECPTCRTKLMRRPAMSFIVREQVQAAVERLPEPDRSIVKKRLMQEDASVKAKQADGDPWKGIFKPIEFVSTVFDKDDDVRRCVSCGWEVIGGTCIGCNTAFSDVEESDNSQDRTDVESDDEDAYDSNDSFINDDEDEDEIDAESEGSVGGSGGESEDDDADSDEEDHRPLTRASRRQRRSQMERQTQQASKRSRRNLLRRRGASSQPIELDDDENDEPPSTREEDEDDDLQGIILDDDLGEDDGSDGDAKEEKDDNDEEDVPSRPRRTKAVGRRVIQLSDDDDEESESVQLNRPAATTQESGSRSSNNDRANIVAEGKKRRRLADESEEDEEKEEINKSVEEIVSTSESEEASESESESESDSEQEQHSVDSEDDFVIDRPKKKNVGSSVTSRGGKLRKGEGEASASAETSKRQSKKHKDKKRKKNKEKKKKDEAKNKKRKGGGLESLFA
ncbi:E3 ubiquitin ligase [Actinomortierella wolfii]|nr:E3 ubiquitin ligase [Actinomortierella wolfii]